MLALRLLCILIFVSLSIYTAPIVIAEPNLFPAIFGPILAGGTWQGQFNMDFIFMLTLSGLWVGWRHGGTPAGLALGLLAFLGGAMFQSVYLLVQSFRCGSVREILVGR